MSVLAWVGRFVLVMAMLCAAAALATPPGRLPLALRGLNRILHKDRGEEPPPDAKASPARRFAAFVLVLLAALVALI